MEGTRKWKKVSFSTILWAIMAILLCALPCSALDYIAEEVSVPPSSFGGSVVVQSDGTLNLLIGGTINGTIGVEGGGMLNLEGGYVQSDVHASNDSKVNIKGGDIGGNGYWDIYVEGTADITVFGTNFSVTNGTIDSDASGTYFTADGLFAFCHLKGSYEVGGIDLIFYINSDTTRIYLANPSTTIEVQIDIKPGSYPNSINLGSHGVVPVAILSTLELDATTLNAGNIFLAGSGVRVRGKGNKYLASEEDVNGDSLLDLVVKVETENLDPGAFQDGGAFLRVHETSDPESPVLYEGWDEINIVPQ